MPFCDLNKVMREWETIRDDKDKWTQLEKLELIDLILQSCK